MLYIIYQKLNPDRQGQREREDITVVYVCNKPIVDLLEGQNCQPT